LHHTNVDRLFSIWEAMNPTSDMTPLPEAFGTFVIPRGTMEGVHTPLEPFTMSSNGPWYDSSASHRSTKHFGYTYPGLNDWNKTQEQQIADATIMVNSMYNPSNAFSRRSPDGLARRRRIREWSVALSVAKFDLRGERFIILLFLGDVPAKPRPTSAGCVGSFPVFPPPVPPTAAGGFPLVVAYSEYSLNDGLKAEGLGGQDVAATKKYLRANLRWRVTQVDGFDFLVIAGGTDSEIVRWHAR